MRPKASCLEACASAVRGLLLYHEYLTAVGRHDDDIRHATARVLAELPGLPLPCLSIRGGSAMKPIIARNGDGLDHAIVAFSSERDLCVQSIPSDACAQRLELGGSPFPALFLLSARTSHARKGTSSCEGFLPSTGDDGSGRLTRSTTLASSIAMSRVEETPVAISQSVIDSGTVWNANCRNGT